jgi:FkbM family methyltransferase
MPLSKEQLARIAERFPTLAVPASATVMDSYFEPRVRIGEGATVKWSHIGAGSVIGEGAEVHGAAIGEGCMIGKECRIGVPVGAAPTDAGFCETRIGNGARIGEGSTIGVGSVVAEGAVVPAGARIQAAGGGRRGGESLRDFLFEHLPLFHVHRHWVAARGDQRMRVEYPLQSSDLVLDVGGYLGDWAEEMVRRYQPRIHVFEPVGSFVEAIRGRLGGAVVLHEFGLAGRTREETITLAAEGSSVIKGGGGGMAAQERIKLVAAGEVLRGLPREIALLKVNIEGCEYELLEHLIEEGLIARIRFLQVQFHDFVPGAGERRRRLREALAATHEPTFNYPFIWEGWTRRDPRGDLGGAARDRD